MAMENTAPVLVCDTVLRDIYRSSAALSLTGEDITSVYRALDESGYYALECWSDQVMDYWRLKEENNPWSDPWEMLAQMKQAFPETRLQMFLRTRALLAGETMTDEALDAYILHAIESGIDIFRVYDAENDRERLVRVMRTIKKYGAAIEAAFCYRKKTGTNDTTERIVRDLTEAGADILSVMDLNRELTKTSVTRLIEDIRKWTRIPLNLRVRHADGAGEEILMKAVEAGVDIVDTSLSLFADRFSQPVTESFITRMQGVERDPGLDSSQLRKASEGLLKAAA